MALIAAPAGFAAGQAGEDGANEGCLEIHAYLQDHGLEVAVARCPALADELVPNPYYRSQGTAKGWEHGEPPGGWKSAK